MLRNSHFLPFSRYLWKGNTYLTLLAGSVTRLGDLLDFGQLFKAFVNI